MLTARKNLRRPVEWMEKRTLGLSIMDGWMDTNHRHRLSMISALRMICIPLNWFTQMNVDIIGKVNNYVLYISRVPPILAADERR